MPLVYHNVYLPVNGVILLISSDLEIEMLLYVREEHACNTAQISNNHTPYEEIRLNHLLSIRVLVLP